MPRTNNSDYHGNFLYGKAGQKPKRPSIWSSCKRVVVPPPITLSPPSRTHTGPVQQDTPKEETPPAETNSSSIMPPSSSTPPRASTADGHRRSSHRRDAPDRNVQSYRRRDTNTNTNTNEQVQTYRNTVRIRQTQPAAAPAPPAHFGPPQGYRYQPNVYPPSQQSQPQQYAAAMPASVPASVPASAPASASTPTPAPFTIHPFARLAATTKQCPWMLGAEISPLAQDLLHTNPDFYPPVPRSFRHDAAVSFVVTDQTKQLPVQFVISCPLEHVDHVNDMLAPAGSGRVLSARGSSGRPRDGAELRSMLLDGTPEIELVLSSRGGGAGIGGSDAAGIAHQREIENEIHNREGDGARRGRGSVSIVSSGTHSIEDTYDDDEADRSIRSWIRERPDAVNEEQPVSEQQQGGDGGSGGGSGSAAAWDPMGGAQAFPMPLFPAPAGFYMPPW